MQGLVNKIVFPVPPSSYTKSSLHPNIIFLPNYFTTKPEPIPCLYHRSSINKYIILYFHANGEDIGHIDSFLEVLSIELGCSIIAPEFPGYGIRKGSPSEMGLYQTAESIYYFLTKAFNYPSSNIVVMGRSIGTSAATYLGLKTSKLFNNSSFKNNRSNKISEEKKAQKTIDEKIGNEIKTKNSLPKNIFLNDIPLIRGNVLPFKHLVLLSGFTSINEMANKIIFNNAGMLIRSSFDNIKRIKYCTNCLTIIHGEKDELVPAEFGLKLLKTAENCDDKRLFLREDMNHNSFDLQKDIVGPMKEVLGSSKTKGVQLKLPAVYFNDVI